ncbi:MAG: ABC transporter ATP-binding protein [Clostridiales Family XIII bacterium]|jgi:simple sugar transport system ATP-binding protein|nr:ABC transporter ATP-binding protein [Clostridiales Family XIII bacterium]
MAYIELKGITKRFDTVYANDGIDLEIHKGEIHALLGENGSGKTTLMNILYGRYRSDGGSILVGGVRRVFKDPADSIKAGIGMIHQHPDLVDTLSVEQNIAAGMGGGVVLARKSIRARIEEIAAQYELAVDPTRKIYQLSVGEKQTVEILKTFYRGVDVLILDEPTSVLAPPEARALFENLVKIKARGCAIVLITHKMHEVFEVSDRVSVLRKGRMVYTAPTAETTREILTEKMVGHALAEQVSAHHAVAADAERILRVQGLSVMGPFGQPALTDVNLEVARGEIHGIAGVAGSGQKELCDAIAGMCKVHEGEIYYHDKDITRLPIARRRAQGIRIGYIPEDRMDAGLVGEMKISGNVMLRRADYAARVFYSEKAARAYGKEILDAYKVDAVGPQQPVKNLSGGNIQKVLLGREIGEDPDLLITAYPVRGLDIGATDFIFQLLRKKREEGMSIVMVGEDLDVLLEQCDRISVMYHGRIVATFDADPANKGSIGACMAGAGGAA